MDQIIEKNQIDQLVAQRYNINQRKLNLSLCQEWQQVIHHKDWSNLSILFICYNEIYDDNLKVISKFKWPNLTNFHFYGNKITAKGIKQLFIQSQWPKLQFLSLGDNKIEDEGLQNILKYIHKNLTHLDLYKCGIKSRGISLMAQYDFINLRWLWLGENNIGNRGMKWLSKVKLPNLQSICISCYQISEEGFKHLTKTQWPKLSELQLRDQFESSSLQVLCGSNWKELKKLTLNLRESICWLNIALVQTLHKPLDECPQISNQRIKNSINTMLINKGFV